MILAANVRNANNVDNPDAAPNFKPRFALLFKNFIVS